MPLISCENLSKTYESEGVFTQAVGGVTFTIDRGDFVSIMGPSGSGKSTLMHMLGLLDRPTSGQYLFAGENVASFDEDTLARFRNKRLGFVFQSFNLLARTSVYENVELPLLYNIYNRETENRKQKTENGQDAMKGKICWGMFGGMNGKCNRDKVERALLSVGMEKRIEYKSNQLSGGEKQRVAIARALVNDPDVIFADEPTGNLDSKSGLQVMRILQDLNSQGKTIILVTHETYTAEHAKRIIRMRDGMIERDEMIPEERRRDARKGEDMLK